MATAALITNIAEFPSVGGSGFRFGGKFGECHLDNLYSMAVAYEHRKPARKPVEITRTPELLIVMAMLKALPIERLRSVSREVAAVSEKSGDEIARAADYITSAVLVGRA